MFKGFLPFQPSKHERLVSMTTQGDKHTLVTKREWDNVTITRSWFGIEGRMLSVHKEYPDWSARKASEKPKRYGRSK